MILKAIKVLSVLYLSFSFATLEFNPADWRIEVRTFFVMLFLFSWIMWSAKPKDGFEF